MGKQVRQQKGMSFVLRSCAPEPIYVQLGQQLKEHITRGKLTPGTPLPNIGTIANVAGVSIKTAERALNGLIHDGVCVRRPKKGTYVADVTTIPTPSSSVVQPAIAFVLIGSDFSDSYHSRVLKGAEEAASGKGHTMIFRSIVSDDPAAVVSVVKDIIASRHSVKSLLLGGKTAHEIVKAVAASLPNEISLVVMGRTESGYFNGVTHVTDSNGLAARTALACLTDAGHKRIALLNGPQHWSWNSEIAAEFKSFLAARGLPLITGVALDDLDDDDAETGYKATNGMLGNLSKSGVTAIVCGTDKLAQGAMRSLREDGVVVPDQVSVVGLGNLGFGQYLDPPLTTVDQCEEEKGREGVRASLGGYPPGAIVKIPVRLVERKSVRALGV